jgi:hypothetical protein
VPDVYSIGHMRIVITGDRAGSCNEPASVVLRRLIARYGPEIIVVHGGGDGVDASFAEAAKALGIAIEVRAISRETTMFPMVGQRNHELLRGGANLCVAVHRQVASCEKTVDLSSKPYCRAFSLTWLRMSA